MTKIVFFNVYYLDRRTNRRGYPFWKVVGMNARRHPRDEQPAFVEGFVSRSAKNRWNAYSLKGRTPVLITKKSTAKRAIKALKAAL